MSVPGTPSPQPAPLAPSAAAAPAPAASSAEAYADRRLSEFVDRRAEMALFCDMLGSSEKSIMVVWGEIGLGKTWLRMRMVHECAARKLRKAEVVWKDSYAPDYLAIMRKIRDDLGLEPFGAFTDLVNFYTDASWRPKLDITVSGNVSVAQGLAVEGGSKVGEVAGVDIAVPEEERRARLTQLFLSGLQASVAASPVVVFLDGVEKMSVPTERWLWEQLLDAARSGDLENVRFVLCGETPPPGDRDWDFVIVPAPLQPLGHGDIVAYLQKRAPALDEQTCQVVADLVLANSKGKPAEVAKQVQMLCQMMARRPDGSA
jgi:hypothetical protein